MVSPGASGGWSIPPRLHMWLTGSFVKKPFPSVLCNSRMKVASLSPFPGIILVFGLVFALAGWLDLCIHFLGLP